MSQERRLGRIITILRARRTGADTADLLRRLEVSRATLFRDIAALRDMRYPIVYDKEQKRWRLEQGNDPAFIRDELPGMWITPQEGYAFLTLHNVLRRIDPGFLEEYVAPLRDLIRRILGNRDISTPGLSRKVAVELGDIRPISPKLFARLSEALVRDCRLRLTFADKVGAAVTHEVSPQRVLLTLRGWQLDVLDHDEGGLCSIEFPAIRRAEVLSAPAERDSAFDVPWTTQPERRTSVSAKRRHGEMQGHLPLEQPDRPHPGSAGTGRRKS